MTRLQDGNSDFSDLLTVVDGSNAHFVANGVGFSFETNGGAGNTSSGTARMTILNGGNVGIGTTTPQATLDVNGYLRLAKNSSQPVACSSTSDGAIALTHLYTLCICKGGSTSWVQESNGTTACSW